MTKTYAAAEKAARLLNMPLEYASGFPRVQLDGYGTVRVEAHRGVRAYAQDCVELGARGALIRVRGKKLELRRLSAELAVICGTINCVELVYEEGTR